MKEEIVIKLAIMLKEGILNSNGVQESKYVLNISKVFTPRKVYKRVNQCEHLCKLWTN